MRAAAAFNRLKGAIVRCRDLTDESVQLRPIAKAMAGVQFRLGLVGSAAATSLTNPFANVGIIAIFMRSVN
jgi:hypothetical protein